MSELARITAHYLAVLLEREGLSASIPDMRAELEAAAEADAQTAERLAGETADTRIDRIRQAAADETNRGRAERRQVKP